MHRVKTNSIRNIFFFFIYPFFRQKLAGVTASQVIPFSIFFGLSSIDSRARKTSNPREYDFRIEYYTRCYPLGEERGEETVRFLSSANISIHVGTNSCINPTFFKFFKILISVKHKQLQVCTPFTYRGYSLNNNEDLSYTE